MKNTKRFFAIILVVIISLSVTGCSKPNPATDFEYTVGKEGITITNYIGKDKTVVIPEKIDGKPVKTISHCRSEDIESVSIPSSVTIIWDGALQVVLL